MRQRTTSFLRLRWPRKQPLQRRSCSKEIERQLVVSKLTIEFRLRWLVKFCNITIESCALYLLTLIKTTTTTFPWEYTGGHTTRVAVVVIAKRDQSRRQPIMVNVLGKLNTKSKAESFPQTDLRLHCSLSPLRCIAWGFAVANCWFVCDQSPLHFIIIILHYSRLRALFIIFRRARRWTNCYS